MKKKLRPWERGLPPWRLSDQDDHDAVVAEVSRRLDEVMIAAVARADAAPVAHSEVDRYRALHPVADPWIRKSEAKKDAAARKAAARKVTAARKAEAIKKGDAPGLLRLLTEKKVGRPKGATSTPKTDEEREAHYQIHRAVGMVPLAEGILNGMYPGQPKKQVRYCALEAVEHFVGGSVTVSKLEHHMALPKNDRRRLLVKT